MSARHLVTRWVGTGAAALVVGSAAVLGAASPAAAAACSTAGSGVTVVVRGSVGCAGGDPSTALAALHAAGHSTVMVQRFPAALCRIDGAPASDPCVVMPPSSAYWSLWTAKRGGSWVFASTSVVSYNPAPGTVVGFAFGAGSPPSVAPPAAPAPAPTRTSKPKPTPTHSTAAPTRTSTAPRTTASSGGSAPGHGATPTSDGPAPDSSTPASGVARTPTEPPASPAPTATDVAGASLDDAAPASATSPLGPSGPWPLLAGGVLVLALGGATAYVVRRRRG